jgi:hypothetical protein
LTGLMRHKEAIYFISGLIGFIIGLTILAGLLSSGRRELELLENQRKEMITLKEEFLSLRRKVDFVEGKKNLSSVEGVVQAVDEVFSFTGLKDKVKTVKSTGRKEIRDGFEEEADVYLEKITMNEMINIFYRIENAPMVLTVKKAEVKKSFENPQLLNISLSVSFLKAK